MDDRLPPDIAVEPMGSTAFVCLLPRGHRLARRRTLRLGDLQDEVLISYRGNTRPADELAHAARAAGVDFSPSLEIDVSISALGFLQAGLGVAVVDALLPWQQFAGLELRPLVESPRLPVSLLKSRDRPLLRAEEIMCDYIREACAFILNRPGKHI